MPNFYVPMTITVLIRDIDKDELETRIDEANFALSEAFYSSDANDDHFELQANQIHWNKIQKENNDED